MASWAYDGQDTALAGAVAAPSSALGLIRRMLRRHRGRLAGSYLLLSLWQICEALVPVAIGMIIDHAIAPGDLTAFVIGAAGLCVLMGVLSFAYRYGARLGFGAVQREQHALRVELTAHVLHPRGAQTGLLPGETLAVATGDAAAVGLVVRQLGYAFSAVAVLIFCAVYLLTLDLWLGLLVLIGVPVSIGLTQLVSPVIARRFGTEQAAVARAAGMATDLVEGMRPLKGVGAEHLASARYHDVSRAAERAAVQTVRGWAGLAAVTTAVSGLLLAAVALVAGARALSGDLSLGEFIAVVGLTQFLAEPVAQIGFIGADAARSSASASRIVEVLQAPRRIVEGHRAPGSPYGLRLAHVATGPLRDVTLHADEGELVAVVVDDPACSDALVGVLTGERTPDSGEAVLGDARIDGLDVDARRRALLVAEHRVDLFDGTVRTNVDPHGTADASRLAEVLDASAADDVVALHPDGLERHVRVSGSLSGGQRQRLALARALIADAPVLLLQDPTSAVDSVTEEAIARGVRTFRHRPRPAAPRTTVIVTTSPSLLAQADRVHLVRDGRTVAEGVHAELLDRDDYVEAVLR